MKNSSRKQQNRQQGQSLLEMALVSLIFFFLLFGIIEFGRALWTYNTIVQSTRQAARWAVVNVANAADTTDINRARNIVVYGYPDVSSGAPLLPGLDSATVTVTILPLQTDASGTAINEKISVSVSNFQFRFIVPIAPTITIPAFETTLFTESKGDVPA